MSEDLEIIKECIHQIRWSDADGEYDMVIDAASRMAAEIERLETPSCIVADNICPIDTMNCKISALKCEIARLESFIITLSDEKNNETARLKTELEKYKKESRPMKTKDPNSIGTECPDGVIRECCYDEETHKFLPPENKTAVTNEACSVCVALKEKIEYWKKQFDLEVVGRRKAEAELEKYNISAFLETEYAMISKMSDADKMDLISRLLRVNNNLANAKENELKALNEIGRLKAELAKRPEVNCDQTNCKHNTEKKCVSSKLYFECLYSDNGRMDCDYFQRRENEEGK